MLPHWCQDETNALLAVLGGASPVLLWVKMKYRTILAWFQVKFGHQCHAHEHKCDKTHPCEIPSEESTPSVAIKVEVE